MNELAPLLAIALQHWIDAGATAEQIAQMQEHPYPDRRPAEFSGFLANTDAHGITIDSQRCGLGLVRRSDAGRQQRIPRHDLADRIGGQRRQRRQPYRPAHRGRTRTRPRDRLDDSTSPGVMNVALDLGERRLPDAADVALAAFDAATYATSRAPDRQAAPPVPVIRGDRPATTAIDAGHGSGSRRRGGADHFVFANVDSRPQQPPPLHACGGLSLHRGRHLRLLGTDIAIHTSGHRRPIASVRAVEDASGDLRDAAGQHRDERGGAQLCRDMDERRANRRRACRRRLSAIDSHAAVTWRIFMRLAGAQADMTSRINRAEQFRVRLAACTTQAKSR